MTCPRRRCAPGSGRARLGDGSAWAQDHLLAWFTGAGPIARWISLENRCSPNPSRARARCHGRARHILAHTLPQTLSRCDLSLPSSRRHIDPAAIAWSQPRRACATPNTPVPSPCSSLGGRALSRHRKGAPLGVGGEGLRCHDKRAGVPVSVPLPLLRARRARHAPAGSHSRATNLERQATIS